MWMYLVAVTEFQKACQKATGGQVQPNSNEGPQLVRKAFENWKKELLKCEKEHGEAKPLPEVS